MNHIRINTHFHTIGCSTFAKAVRKSNHSKMYPTWEPSNHGEKTMIATKYEKIAVSTTSQVPPPAIFPPPLDFDALHLGSRTLPIVHAEHGPPSRKHKLQMNASPHFLGGKSCTLFIDIPSFSPLARRKPYSEDNIPSSPYPLNVKLR